MELRRLGPNDLGLIAGIDRSEHVDVEYRVVHGELARRPVTLAEIPAWDVAAGGPHSVAAHVAFCRQRLEEGAEFLGAFDEDGRVLGLAVVHPTFEPDMAWLAFLHVSRPHRRAGVASALWQAAAANARAAGATSMYVSAVPTGSAVGFYLRQGCELARPVHPELYAAEPDDIHLVCRLG